VDKLQLPSFCKINWLLNVLGKREDGYHEVNTILQTIDLHDEVSIRVDNSSAKLKVTSSGRSVPAGRDNIAWLAANRLRENCSVKCGAHIHLVKRVPVGGGLGGGSSNAATTLMALNQLWNCGLDYEELSKIAAGIGSDVPFFLTGGTAAALGRGERIEPLQDAPPERLILYAPNSEISTEKAYTLGRWPSLISKSTLLTKVRVNTKIQRFRALVDRGQNIRDLIENDFETPISRHYHDVAEARSLLLEAGCDRVLLCGSGSTVMGIVSEQRTRPVVQFLVESCRGEVFESGTLSRNRYREILNNSGLILENF
jgi:4-diphosphocytidyl-2-C-methyl-D-erythritol kinase